MNRILILFLALVSCSDATINEEREVLSNSPVEITHMRYGSVSDNLDFYATTVYLKRNVVTSAIPGYITKVYVQLGDKIKEGTTLYELESKEHRALGTDAFKDQIANEFGIIKVTSSASGIVTSLDKQEPGDYVLEGTPLCTIAQDDDLALQINVPFEFSHFAKVGTSCNIITPDGTSYTGTITTPLSTMNSTSQTQIVLAKINRAVFLPENLIVKVQINKSVNTRNQILPRASILSDEMMKEFWIMKMINDSTAIKIPIKTGSKNQDDVEILEPTLSTEDRIISIGNYGLRDTARVFIRQ